MLDPEISPYLLGPYAPTDQEVEPHALSVIQGELPRDLLGTYVRNGPNPQFSPKGRYHWFDGDGMLHAVRFEDGRATYRNRFVHTSAFEKEREEGAPLWSGVMESIRDNPKGEPWKNSANTDVIPYNGGLLALWYISGVPYRVGTETLETLGVESFGAERPTTMSAHAKVDPASGELSFFDYSVRQPFMSYGWASADGREVRKVPVELPAPCLPHDLGMTENYAILMDLNVVYDTEALAQKRWVTKFDKERPARFGVLPRVANADAMVRWFEAEPCYMYHLVNTYEDGDEIVMVGCRVADPIPEPDRSHGVWAKMLANLRVVATLHRWRLNLETGAVTEEVIDDLNTEFPTINASVLGRRSRYTYNARLENNPTLRFDALVKYDVESGKSETFELGAGHYGSEAAFAQRVGGTEEDDGYVMSFVHNAPKDRSELWVFDARQIAAGPMATLALPQRVPLGFHACFAPGDQNHDG